MCCEVAIGKCVVEELKRSDTHVGMGCKITSG